MNQAITTPEALPAPPEGQQAPIDADSLYRGDPLASFFRFRLKLTPLTLGLLAIVYFGLFEKFLLPALCDTFLNTNILRFGGGIRSWNPHVEALLTGFVEFPIFLAYYLWTGDGVAALFTGLVENKSFQNEAKFCRFLAPAFKSMGNRFWALPSLAFAILVVLAMNFIIWSKDSLVPPWFGDLLFFRILALFNIGLITYVVMQVLIREGLVVTWLGRMWRRLDDQLTIHPYHADGAGGLGIIGGHALGFFYFVLAVFIFIAMATIYPEFIRPPDPEAGFQVRFWNNLLLVLSLIYFILVPLIFSLLIWPAHKAMQRKRDEQLRVYSENLDGQLKLAQADAGGERNNLPDILKEVSDLKNFRAVILEDYPTWPLSTDTKRLFGLTSFIPTVYSIATFIFNLFS